MTRNYSKSQMAAYASALARASMPPGLKAVAAAFDELREVAAKAARTLEMARLAPPPMTTSPVLSLNANLAKLSRDLCGQVQPACDCCCHYQTHPPRCQLSKRSISPKQFSCKKYSPKFNRRH